MSDGKVFDLQPSYNDFGLKPREGFKYCLDCKATLPLKAFYKKDCEDPKALCKKHKNKDRATARAVHKLTKLDSTFNDRGDK